MNGNSREPSNDRSEAEQLASELQALGADIFPQARKLTDQGHGRLVSYSPKVFLPVTRLCRDVCSYCTFVRTPRASDTLYLSVDEVLALSRRAADAGCTEALFTLGDKPELRYPAAAHELERLGYASTIDYVAALCELVIEETGLLPHVNAGVMGARELEQLRRVSVSQGLMLEQATIRLGERGGPHFGSPDKEPDARIEMIDVAGRLAIPFTSGILIGIGETLIERIESLLTLRDLHRLHGHLQEIIIQNFRAKPMTRMAHAAEPGLDDLMWTAAAARLIFGPQMNIQVPPNLSFSDYSNLLDTGINDWGGVSPITPDHVNPEAPWPPIEQVRQKTEAAGRILVPRLPLYPSYAMRLAHWTDPHVRPAILRQMDSEGFARADAWSPGLSLPPPHRRILSSEQKVSGAIGRILNACRRKEEVSAAEIMTLFRARGADEAALLKAADMLRQERVGDRVGYVVNRNINYTNVCAYSCKFCAFSKGRRKREGDGMAYDLDLDEIVRRAREAWDRGATEVCMQGGIHPAYSGHTYLSILRAVKEALPDIHIHAFSPLEVTHGAKTLGLGVPAFLRKLKDAGLSSLPGTAAEILVDEVRAIICPEKISSDEWVAAVRAAHDVGLRTTATIMFGHVEHIDDWAAHLLRLRALQSETGGVTEFVPLPFVHMEAPIYRNGGARKGPTFREALLMTAVARLVLAGLIDNIQVSWVKMGAAGVAAALAAGANDLGGTLMNESISRAAGTAHGQEMEPAAMEAVIRAMGRMPYQRTTLYGEASLERHETAHHAIALQPLQVSAAGKYARIARAARADRAPL